MHDGWVPVVIAAAQLHAPGCGTLSTSDSTNTFAAGAGVTNPCWYTPPHAWSPKCGLASKNSPGSLRYRKSSGKMLSRCKPFTCALCCAISPGSSSTLPTRSNDDTSSPDANRVNHDMTTVKSAAAASR